MEFTVELEIPKSSSSNLKKILRKARKFDHFEEPAEGGEPYRLRLEKDEFRKRYTEFQDIYFGVRGWKGTELLLNGEVAGWNDINEILKVLRCAQERSKAVLEEKYCESGYYPHNWGCRHLTMITEGNPASHHHSHWESAYWFEFGSFQDGLTIWTVDKAAVGRGIQREVENRSLVLCPYFDLDAAEERVEALPSKIHLGEDSDWEIVFEEEYHENTVQQVPKGVRLKRSPEDSLFGPGLSLSIGLAGSESGMEEEVQGRTTPDVSFEDVGGVDSIIGLVREVIELPLVQPQLLKHLGIMPHKGILLYGPPGCGKTLIAKAIANEISAHFISIRGPELFNKFIGQSEENLRRVFDEAKEYSPSIIFFDEIDAIAHSRSSEETAIHYSVFVNQLLTLMDGMEEYPGVCVIAATNRPELLDAALLRPGRFDYVLEVEKPTREGCHKILSIHSRNMPLDPTVDIKALSKRMEGLTGAEIAYVAREGAYNCLRRNTTIEDLILTPPDVLDLEEFQVSTEDLEKALAGVLSEKEVSGDP